MEHALSAQAEVNVGRDEARQWFLELERHPERYRFATHAGFKFVNGNFGEIGAQFQTQERFFGLRLTLRFELTALDTYRFRFRLLHPPLPLWGVFSLGYIAETQTKVQLQIGSDQALGRWALNVPMIRVAIRRQIQREVNHIKESMERLKENKI
ncbi:MAG: hypothetical protein ACP5HM_12960 [Anaerolineae bacterium]